MVQSRAVLQSSGGDVLDSARAADARVVVGGQTACPLDTGPGYRENPLCRQIFRRLKCPQRRSQTGKN